MFGDVLGFFFAMFHIKTRLGRSYRKVSPKLSSKITALVGLAFSNCPAENDWMRNDNKSFQNVKNTVTMSNKLIWVKNTLE